MKQKWISTKDRLPTEEDANEGGYVLAVFSVADYANCWNWSDVARHPEVFPYWMPVPESPKTEWHERRKSLDEQQSKRGKGRKRTCSETS